MAKLTLILASKVNNVSQVNTFTALNSAKVFDVVPSTTNPYSTTLMYKRLGGTTKEVYEAASAPSAVRALLDVNPTSDVQVLPVTVNNIDGTTTSKGIQIESIHHIIVDPLNSARSIVFVEDQVKTQITALNVTATLAALVAAANA